MSRKGNELAMLALVPENLRPLLQNTPPTALAKSTKSIQAWPCLASARFLEELIQQFKDPSAVSKDKAFTLFMMSFWVWFAEQPDISKPDELYEKVEERIAKETNPDLKDLLQMLAIEIEVARINEGVLRDFGCSPTTEEIEDAQEAYNKASNILKLHKPKFMFTTGDNIKSLPLGRA